MHIVIIPFGSCHIENVYFKVIHDLAVPTQLFHEKGKNPQNRRKFSYIINTAYTVNDGCQKDCSGILCSLRTKVAGKNKQYTVNMRKTRAVHQKNKI